LKVVIIGSGFAGLSAAINLSRAGVSVEVISSEPQGGSSPKAQGGIAIPLDPGDVELHVQDTIKAGKGLNDEGVVRQIVGLGQETLDWLRSLGFEPDFERSLEAGHSRPRVVRAKLADSIGAEVMKVLERAFPNVERDEALSLLVENGKVVGVRTKKGELQADSVVLATGGYSGLYQYRTNDGLGIGTWMAFQAGAYLRDLEFVQFHPTVAFAGESAPGLLLTEALRGEGAKLLNDKGERFAFKYDPAGELATRDVLSRAEWHELSEGRTVYLDVRGVPRFSERFPFIYSELKKMGIDPSRDLVPVRPGSHFTIGGVAVDAAGRSSVRGLFALGEAGNGLLHGANRLASNSILWALAQGFLLARALQDYAKSGSWPLAAQANSIDGGTEVIRGSPFPRPSDLVLSYDPAEIPQLNGEEELRSVRKAMWDCVSLVRDEELLEKASSSTRGLARLVVLSALARRDSVGVHFRSDYPSPPLLPYHVYVKGEAN